MIHKKQKMPSCKKTKGKNRITLMFVLAFFFCINSALLSLDNFINKTVINNLGSRTLYGYIENDEKSIRELEAFLEEDDRVLSYIPYVWAGYFSSDDLKLSSVSVFPCDYEAIKPYLLMDCGEPEGNELIVAKYITDQSMDSLLKEEGKEWADGEHLVGKTLKGTLQCGNVCGEVEAECEFKVIGVYDNVKAGMDSGDFLLSPESCIWIDEKTKEETNYNPDLDFMGWATCYQVVLKDGTMAESMCDLLMSQSYNSSWSHDQGIWKSFAILFQAAMILINFFLLMLLANTFIHIVYVTERDIRSRRHEFGLLKALGYRQRNIMHILCVDVLKDTGISLGAAFLIGLIVLRLCKAGADKGLNLYFRALRFTPDLRVVLIMLAMAVSASALGYFVSAGFIRRMEAVDMLKDAESEQ